MFMGGGLYLFHSVRCLSIKITQGKTVDVVQANIIYLIMITCIFQNFDFFAGMSHFYAVTFLALSVSWMSTLFTEIYCE